MATCSESALEILEGHKAPRRRRRVETVAYALLAAALLAGVTVAAVLWSHPEDGPVQKVAPAGGSKAAPSAPSAPAPEAEGQADGTARVDALVLMLCPAEPRTEAERCVADARRRMAGLKEVKTTCVEQTTQVMLASAGPETGAAEAPSAEKKGGVR